MERDIEMEVEMEMDDRQREDKDRGGEVKRDLCFVRWCQGHLKEDETGCPRGACGPVSRPPALASALIGQLYCPLSQALWFRCHPLPLTVSVNMALPCAPSPGLTRALRMAPLMGQPFAQNTFV